VKHGKAVRSLRHWPAGCRVPTRAVWWAIAVTTARITALATTLLAIGAAFFPAATPAQPYAIDRWTIDGGGAGLASAGGFHLSGTIGQYDAGSSRPVPTR